MFSCVGRGLAKSESPPQRVLPDIYKILKLEEWKDFEIALSCASQEGKEEEERKAVPKLEPLVPGFPLRRPGFEPRLGHVGSVVDKVPLRQVFS
jgi:hypothetical protein